jgi:hypothetical protein
LQEEKIASRYGSTHEYTERAVTDIQQRWSQRLAVAQELSTTLVKKKAGKVIHFGVH